MLAIVFLFIDFLCFALLSEWIVYSSLTYLINVVVAPKTTLHSVRFYLALACFLLLDFAMHQRVGLCLAFIFVMVILTTALKPMLLQARGALFTLWTILFFIYEHFVIKYYVFSLSVPLSVTIIKILVNLGIGYAMLWGRWGNRSLIT